MKPNPYPTSRDYERLFREMQFQSIICLFRDGGKMRVAQTMYSKAGLDGLPCWQVVSATLYLYAHNKDTFIVRCQQYGIEVLFPPEAPAAPVTPESTEVLRCDVCHQRSPDVQIGPSTLKPPPPLCSPPHPINAPESS